MKPSLFKTLEPAHATVASEPTKTARSLPSQLQGTAALLLTELDKRKTQHPGIVNFDVDLDMPEIKDRRDNRFTNEARDLVRMWLPELLATQQYSFDEYRVTAEHRIKDRAIWVFLEFKVV